MAKFLNQASQAMHKVQEKVTGKPRKKGFRDYPWLNRKPLNYGRLRPRMFDKKDRKMEIVPRLMALREVCQAFAKDRFNSFENGENVVTSASIYPELHEDIAVMYAHVPREVVMTYRMNKKSWSLYNSLARYARRNGLI